MRIRPLLIIGILALTGWGGGSAYAQSEEVWLSRFPKSANQFVAAQILVEVYRKCGVVAKVGSMPPARAPVEALSGRVDGEVSRVFTHLDDNPGLIRVSPAFDYFAMTAFSRLPVTIKSKDDLKKYRVGIIRGLKAAANLTESLDNVEKASNSESLFLMLAAGRFDVAIDVDINGAFQMAKHNLKDVHPAGELLRSEVFHYLGPRKAHLQPVVSARIAEMKRSGELERLKKRFSQEFVKRGVEPD